MATGDVEVNLTNPLVKECISMDGVDDSLISSSAVNVSDNILSFSCWVYFNNVSSTQQIINNSPASSRRFAVDLQSGVIEGGYYNGSGNVGVRSSSPISAGRWYHVVYTFDGSTGGNLYINGSLDNTGTSAQNTTNYNNVRIGDRGPSTDVLNGYIREVRIYNKVLSASEALKLYQGLDVTDKLIHYWKLETDTNASKGNMDLTGTGTSFQKIDDQIAQAVSADRTTANDKYLIAVTNNKVLTTVIEEAP